MNNIMHLRTKWSGKQIWMSESNPNQINWIHQQTIVLFIILLLLFAQFHNIMISKYYIAFHVWTNITHMNITHKSECIC